MSEAENIRTHRFATQTISAKPLPGMGQVCGQLFRQQVGEVCQAKKVMVVEPKLPQHLTPCPYTQTRPVGQQRRSAGSPEVRNVA